MFTITVICVILSVDYIKQIKNHIFSVRQFLLLLENIKILIMYKNLSVEEIFDFVSKSESYELLGFINVINKSIKDNNEFYKIVDNSLFLKTKNYFDKQDSDDIKNFLLMLGNSDTDGQLLNCDLYKNLFNKKLSILESNEEKKQKTGISLISGIGIVLIILII